MTYEELKNRLTQVETALQGLGSKQNETLDSAYAAKKIQQLNVIKESLQEKLKGKLNEEETMFVSTKGGDTKAVKMDMKTAMDLKKDPAITAIDTAKGKSLKETDGIKFSIDETKAIAKSVGRSLIKALKSLGDEVARIKAHRLEEGSFDIHVAYKGDLGKDEFSFYITDDTLHLVDFSFDKELIEVGVKPSGEAIVNVDVLTNELLKHFRSLSEDHNPDQEQKDDEEDHGVGYDDEGRPLGEGEGDDHHYIKVKSHDYKKAMAILDQNVDPTYVKMDIVDNDGAGNVVIYFIFRHEAGFDDMYDDSDNPDSEFYQETEEDPQAFIYDVVMDLQANDIELADHSADMDENADNSDWAMKIRTINQHGRQMKKLDKLKKTTPTINPDYKKNTGISPKKKAIIDKLEAKRAQVMRDMEQEAEPQGGRIADLYGDMLNKIDTALEKAKGGKTVHYDDRHVDTSANESLDDGNLVTFGYDLDMIQQVVDHLKSKYKEGEDFELYIGRGDDLPNAVTLKNPSLENDHDLNDMLNAAQSDEDRYDAYTDGEDTDYVKRRKEGDDYYEDPNYYKEDLEKGEVKKVKKIVKQLKNSVKGHGAQADYLAKLVNEGHSLSKQELKTLVDGYNALFASAPEYGGLVEFKRIIIGLIQSNKVTDEQHDLNESSARDLDSIFGALGYRQGFDEFIEDNPGCMEVIMEWIGGISEFRERLSNEYSREEQEDLGFYYGDDDDDDDYNESIKESLNPEVSKKVAQFIKAMAKRYGYEEQDAVYAIMAALKQRDFDGVKEGDGLWANINAKRKRGEKPSHGNSKAFKAAKKAGKALAKTKEGVLKEFTDNSFEGADIIRMVAKNSPDMFGKQIFADLLPKGVASEDSAVKALHAHDKSDIKARMGQYAPMFVHVQYHNLKHEGEDYQMHQTQYYNSNFKDKDPDFNPSVSRITLIKDPEGEHEMLGNILVKTEEYVQDLRDLPGLGKRHMEEGANNLLKQDALSPAEYQKAKKLKDFDPKNYKWDKEQELHLIRKMNEEVKIGDILTKDGKKGKVVKVMDDMANVDFGNGDVYGITFGRIKGKEITKEAAPGFKHDCAAKVVHETYGKGNCIPEKHTLVKEGKKYVVTHYDVLFEGGKTVKDIPVSELDIKTTNEHWHKGYKKKKK